MRHYEVRVEVVEIDESVNPAERHSIMVNTMMLTYMNPAAARAIASALSKVVRQFLDLFK